MIYIPEVENYKCVVVQNADSIRAYKELPRVNSNIDYRDYYINSHYVYRDGTQSFGNYNTNIPVCISASELTNNIYYRNDFDSIILIFVCILFFVIYILRKIIRVFFFGFRWC